MTKRTELLIYLIVNSGLVWILFDFKLAGIYFITLGWLVLILEYYFEE